MKTGFTIASLALLVALCPLRAADDGQAARDVKQDLAKLQGAWETTLRAGDKTIRNVQTIKGATSTVDRYDELGMRLHSHTADFELSIKDQVRIFTFSNLRVTFGPRAGAGFKGPLSFIYVVDGDVWTEARGLLADQQDGNPRLMFWTRIVKDEVAARKP